ncbi:MAG TPA: hypothetical protein VJG32_13495 [Anaerolineae bacterium]|nr:hypothetical protein [Anaerolineae bacterium]
MQRSKLQYLIATLVGLVSLWLTLGASADALKQTTFSSTVYLPFVSKSEQANLTGQECPAAVHDRYVTTGPDGKTYPTWHPLIDPQAKCYFNHEHGDDPRTSLADSTLPAFGYVGQIAAMDEPHAGFKVFVANADTRNDEGRRAMYSTRIVSHMGTGGPKRYTTQFHSIEFDLIGRGREIHVAGMADTGSVGGICQRRVGKTVVSLACPNISSLYEIWEMKFSAGNRATTIVSVAAFDPITTYDPNNPARSLLTADAYPRFGRDHHGCDREGYHGPITIRSSGPAEFFTDAFGRSGGPLRQYVSGAQGVGIPMTNDGQTQFKLRRETCGNNLGLAN